MNIENDKILNQSLAEVFNVNVDEVDGELDEISLCMNFEEGRDNVYCVLTVPKGTVQLRDEIGIIMVKRTCQVPLPTTGESEQDPYNEGEADV